MVKLPENDESGFRFWVGGTQETRRDPARFWAPKKPLCLRLHAYVSMVKLPENDESGFKRLFGGTQDTRRDLARFRVKKKVNCSAVFAFNLTIPNELFDNFLTFVFDKFDNFLTVSFLTTF
jgi:hypothetical protein